MISFGQYRQFLTELGDAGIASRSVRSLIEDPASTGAFYIKHDIEAHPDRALKTAQIEAETRHVATYYFQGDLIQDCISQGVLQEIASLGHEIGYHYDVLDSNDGDFDAAKAEFAGYLDQFERAGFAIETVCPHGNPTKLREGWKSNKDFFRAPSVREAYPDILDIVVDFASLMPKGAYISDAGRRLRRIGAIGANDKSNDHAMNDGVEITWSDIARMVDLDEGVVLSLHSHRLYNSEWGKRAELALFSILKRSYLALKGIPIVKKAADRYYHLARRF